MCYKGHLGMIGITGLEPEWEQAICRKRNELLGALHAALPKYTSIEEVIDPEFKKIDASIKALINKLKTLNNKE